MLSFHLESLSSKELYKDVLIRLVHGNEITLNYFELKTKAVSIPFHEHLAEHLVIVMEGAMAFLFDDKTLILKKKDCLFIPANTRHTARVIEFPVKALELYTVIDD
jgi:mannose-6-phosphate isomerase-like protein (cupin superfamily)